MKQKQPFENVILWKIIIIFFLFSPTTFAQRELLLNPTSAEYKLVGGSTLQLVASADGEKLISVTLIDQQNIITIAEAEFVQVKKPVLTAIQISGGEIGSELMERPQFISIGFGEFGCELARCPSSILLVINNSKFVKSSVVNRNNQ